MKISIVMPCHLGEYRNAAKDRERKLIRAINSVMFQDAICKFELLVVADGCRKTIELVKENFPEEHKKGLVRLLEIDKQKPFSGVPRNTGIDFAKGEWICYLDADDIFGPEHLSIIDRNTGKHDWVFFNDMVYSAGQFEERSCFIEPYKCGTSNIAHRKSMQARWDIANTYGRDDWKFIKKLKDESDRWTKIETAEYIVCHIPKNYDV